jgi:fructose 1,6-bisphosphate aldolase/phosphatase
MLTVSAIKADVGSIEGHTRPSRRMLEEAQTQLSEAVRSGSIISFDVTHNGDDICLPMVHEFGEGFADVHGLAWSVFEAATRIAKEEGLYGAGQDLLKDAPSGNVRGAGPGVAEITFDPNAEERLAESFLVLTADKCGPGAYNFPLWAVFTNPMSAQG